MKSIIVISKCLKVENETGSFHFKGIVGGEVINKVTLSFEAPVVIEEGLEYVMYVELFIIDEGHLKGTIRKAKLLSDAMDLDEYNVGE